MSNNTPIHQPDELPEPPDQPLVTNGGAAIGRDVQLAQGDFVGRDQHVRGIRIDGDVSGSVLITGDNNQVIVSHAERRPGAAAEPPFMVAALPGDHVQRSAEFDQLVAYLLAGREKTVAITATIRGAGGFGKTTLAQALCHDPRIRAAFPDGILWTTVGDDPTSILPGLRKLYQALTRQEAQVVDQQDAVLQLRQLLADRRCLLVIDDLWNAAHLQPFLEGGERCARLVTTRMASVIPKGAEVVALDAMSVNEATALLGAGLTAVDPQALAPLARRLGEWPLLLKLVNRRLYEDITQYGLAPAAALTKIGAELDEFGLTAFDVHDAAERSQAVAATIGLSLRSSCFSEYSCDQTVKVWDLARGVLLHSLEGHIPYVQAMGFSRMPGYLLTVSGSQLTVWDYDRGAKVPQFTADGAIFSFEEAADGTIVVGDGLGRVHFLQLVEPA